MHTTALAAPHVRARRLATGLASTLTLTLTLALAACRYPDYRRHRDAPPPPAALSSVPVAPPTDPELAQLPALPVAHLRGNGYARGHAYGRAYAEQWRYAVGRLADHAVVKVREVIPSTDVSRVAVRQLSALIAENFSRRGDAGMPDFLTDDERGYVQGLADGAGLPAEAIQRMIAFVMVSDASCSAFIAVREATPDGRLLQLRNLDWGDEELNVGQQSVLLVHEPPGGVRFLSIGLIGLVGSVSGINEAGISISEIGAGSSDNTWRGTPMPFVIERALATARTLDEAVAVLRDTPTTGGYNFMVGSARERRGAVVEKTARHAAVFEVGVGNYADNPYFRDYAGFDCRASPAADPVIRGLQTCAKDEGEPDDPPVGHGAYETRYKRQLDLVEGWGGKIDLARGVEIGEAIAMRSNAHSILYDFDRGVVYVRNRAWFRDGRVPTSDEDRDRVIAARQPPAIVPLRQIFPPR